MDLFTVAQLSFIGIIGGFMSGLLGIGGGVIIIPLLVYGASLPIKLVTGISMVQAFFATTSAILIHRKHRTVNPRLGLMLGASSVAGGLIGSFGSAFVASEALLSVYLLLVIVSALLLILAPRQERSSDVVVNPATAVPTGLGVGVLAGMLGVGGGFIMTPVLISVLKIPTKVAVGTSLIVVLMTTVAGSFGKIATGQFDLQIAAVVVVGSILGAQGGGRVNARISPVAIRTTMTILLLAIMAITAWDLFVN